MTTTPALRRCPAPVLASSLLASAALLSGCGGGGSSDAPTPVPPPPPPAATTVAITGKAVDGALSGATACYDLNDNGACDTGEPVSAATGADGAFTLNVDTADVGKHRLVVQVPASAVDASTGAAVGTAFTLQSPATGTTTAHSVFVSPLTTLVQGHADSTGASITEATALVQAQAGLAISPLADFSDDTKADNKQAALVARLTQATAMAQADALKALVGQADLSGGTITAAEVNRQTIAAVIGALPTVGGKAADLATAGTTGAALTAAITAAATATVTQAGVTASEAQAAIGAIKLPADTSPAVTGPSAQLTALSYTNANEWFLRSLQNSAADNVPDANNNVRYASVFMLSQRSNYSAAGTVQAWATGGSYARRGDLHWNGTAWAACNLGDRNTSTVRDAQGRSTYNYCNGLEKGRTSRTVADLAGQGIASTFTTKIRTYPGTVNGVAFANWGPADPAAAFGGATFAAGAKLFYQVNTTTETAPAYDVTAAPVTVFSADVAAGGDTRTTAGLACAGTTTAANVATLEDLVARNPGKPCVFAKATSGNDASLDPNESWGTTTTSLATLTGAVTRPDNTGNYYTTDLRLRVAFTAGDSKATTYYSCLNRASNGSARNCSPVGGGTYSIQTLGDARVMSFTGLPSLMQQAGYNRVFIERGGKVFYGYQNPAGKTTYALRLNLDAANAVLAALPGMPALVPATRHADLSTASQAALATAKGAWLVQEDDGSELSLLRIGDGGRYLMGAVGPAQDHEQTGHELGWMDYDAATQTFRALVESNSDQGRSFLLRSAAEQGSEKLTITASQLTSSLGSTLTRITSDTSSLVGLWAIGSATEFNTQHVLFLPNGRVVMIDPLGDTSGGVCTTQRQGPAGGEYASYAWDAATGALHVSGKVYDTNGCAGFFDSSPGSTGSVLDFSAVLTTGGMTATVTSSEGTLTLYRITP